MREQVADGDRADGIFLQGGAREHAHLGEGGEELGDRLEQLEAPLFVEGHQGGADDRLGHRVDAEDRIRRERYLALAILPADLLAVDHLPAPGQHGAHTGETTSIHIRLHDGFDAGETLRATSHRFSRSDRAVHCTPPCLQHDVSCPGRPPTSWNRWSLTPRTARKVIPMPASPVSKAERWTGQSSGCDGYWCRRCTGPRHRRTDRTGSTVAPTRPIHPAHRPGRFRPPCSPSRSSDRSCAACC